MNHYMKIAVEEAREGIRNGHGGPFGCVIVKDGKIIGKGHNEVVKQQDPTCHGEMMAIHEACRTMQSFDLSGCELYTTAQPCPMCLGAILWANVKKVYYGCNIQDTDAIGFRDEQFYNRSEEEQAEFIEEIDRKECKQLFEEYQMIKDKVNY